MLLSAAAGIELFLKLYVTVGRGKQIQNVRAWAFTLASNLVLNHLRAENYRPSISGDDVARWLDMRAQPGVDPEERLLEGAGTITGPSAVAIAKTPTSSPPYLSHDTASRA
jgi:DNA-directed RNA polymerase specialized sigma24 family protein